MLGSLVIIGATCGMHMLELCEDATCSMHMSEMCDNATDMFPPRTPLDLCGLPPHLVHGQGDQVLRAL